MVEAQPYQQTTALITSSGHLPAPAVAESTEDCAWQAMAMSIAVPLSSAHSKSSTHRMSRASLWTAYRGWCACTPESSNDGHSARGLPLPHQLLISCQVLLHYLCLQYFLHTPIYFPSLATVAVLVADL